MKIIKRTIQKNIENSLFKHKIVIIYGPRQVGKTTLVKEILKKFPKNSMYFNCDEPDIREAFTEKTSTEIKAFIGNKKLIILDEAQRIKNIGLTLKLIIDNFPKIQVIATGSSSFELSNKISEPLTGRKYEFILHPFSLDELKQLYNDIEIKRLIERFMVFGMYPEIVIKGNEKELKSLAQSYVYKDIFEFQNIKNPEVLQKLLQALALQVGNEVSYNELAGLVGIDKNTVSNYIQILEKAFIIYRLTPFSRNIRNELKKLRKIYFYDNGIRNALINNLNPVSLRSDVGNLWENFLTTEIIKKNVNNEKDNKFYFWRTTNGQGIDLIEDSGEKIKAYEFKWKKESFRLPKIFSENYPNAEFKLINKENFADFL
ncbi:ATP-binding protein [Patescibacteria group bacterium]|nr:ATP-binding protein [Patescibacteria group bacterium]MBU1662973.1 ATP-binding protein [Patescibacteria group bacterium]MBU1933938.1 ATP-binding protein [Patescibacteria group bacterium]MBU2264480.1 ATP-binding protein [Patescibacteria group bacterium]